MSGNRIGGRLAAETNKKRYGEGFYAKIGSLGGKNSNSGGFAKRAPCNCRLIYLPHTKPQCAGKTGGRVSRKRAK